MADILAGYRKATSKAAAGTAIANLAKQAGVLMYQNDQANIIESQKKADADILQNIIDPDRQRNDAAYAGAVLRNNLTMKFQELDTALDDPASQYSNMEPDAFLQMLTDGSKEFYSTNSKSKHSNVLSTIYSNLTYKYQNSLVAKQAKNYKDVTKSKRANQAVIALSNLPEGEGEDFERNTTAVIESMLDSGTFIDAEIMQYVMTAAMSSADKADRRLLDYAQKYYNVDELMHDATMTAEADYTKAYDRTLDEMYFNEATTREVAAEAGTYTYDQWIDDIHDSEKVDRWTISRINRWYNTAETARGDADGLDAAIWKLKARVPMGTEKESVRQEAMSAVQDELAQQIAAGKITQGQAYDTYASYLEKQSSVDTALKYKIESQLGNATFTYQSVMSPDFQDAITIASALNDRLSDSQMLRQVGEQAWGNYQLWDSLMTQAGGDPEMAAKIYSEQQQAKKDLGADYSASLTRQLDYDSLTTAAIDIATSKDPNDPNSSSWLRSTTGDAFATQEISRYLKEKTLEQMQRTGQSFEQALEFAKKVVGTEFKAFGNEKQYTGGMTMVDMLGLPAGTSEEASDEVWNYFCQSVELDPKKVHARVSGGNLFVLDKDGNDVDGAPSISLTAIGQIWQEDQAEKAEAKAAKNEVDRQVKEQRQNRQFGLQLLSYPGMTTTTPFWKDGPTSSDYNNATQAQQTAWRKEYRSRSTAVARTALSAFDAWIKKDTEWRRAMGFTWGASTMQEK